MSELVMDPKGYFLIKIEGSKIGIAHCNYQDKPGWYDNKVEKSFFSEDPKEILKWVKDNDLMSREDHHQYLLRELDKAVHAIKTKTRYIQD